MHVERSKMYFEEDHVESDFELSNAVRHKANKDNYFDLKNSESESVFR